MKILAKLKDKQFNTHISNSNHTKKGYRGLQGVNGVTGGYWGNKGIQEVKGDYRQIHCTEG